MPEFSRVNPTGLSAKYRFFQPDPTDPSGGFHMYDIVGGPSNGSTVSAEKLNELGIDIPPTPSSVPQRPTWNPPNYVKPGLKSMEDSFLEKGEPTPKPVGEGDYVPGGVYDKSGRLVAPPQSKFPERSDGPWNQNNGPEFSRVSPKTSEVWQSRVDELSKANAPDIQYRDILSTGSKDPLKRGETWKSRVQRFIGYAKDSEARQAIEPQEPEFARSEQGGIKVGVNVKRAADEVTTGYNAPLEAIMVREGMQNALDAVEHLGDKGQVRVEYPSDKEIKISDNGKGMTRKEIETVFSNLHETGKANQEGATGGKGIGKASYMLGGDYFTVSTVAENIFGNGKKTKITVEGTPNEFMEHVPVEEEPVSPNTPTGTTISVKLKEKHSIYTARNMFDNIVKHSRGKGSQIVENRYRERNFPIESGINDTLIGEKTFTDGGTNDVKIGIPKGVELGDRRSINLQVLNNGMYQYTEYGFYTGDSVPNMPEELVVDIHPHAQEGTTEYPFGPNRESIKDKLKSEIFKYVKDTLVDPAKTKQANRLQELYDSMQDFPTTRTKRKAVMFDPGDRLTPAEKEEFQTSPIINSVIELIDKVVDDSLKAIKRPAVAERLEGVGIALSSEEPGQGYYGIHIPHPKAEKSTLLINFLLHVANNKNPADAALGTIFTTLHEDAHIEPVSPGRYYNTSLALSEKSHPKLGKFFEGLMEHGASSGGTTPGHGTDWMNRLGEIYAQYGPTRTFDAAEKLHKILTDNTGGYSPEVQKLLSIYQESRGRDPVTEDILSGTGVKQESTTGGKGNVPPNDKPNGTRTITESINRLKAALETGKLNREEQNTLYSSERSKRAAKLAGVKKPGLEGYYQKLGILKGELPKIPTNTELDDTDVDNLINSIDGSSLRPFEKVTASTALIKLLAGKTPQEGEIKLLTGVFGQDIGNLVNMYSGLGGFRLPKNLVNNLVNLPKSVKSAFDLSAALRQGLPMIDRKEYWKAFYDMHKFFGSKKFFDATMEGIKDDPAYEEATESGLFLAEIGQDLTKREEQFLNSWITYIPGFSGSERAYVGFLNEVRFGVYKSLMEDSKRIGKKVNPEELSKFINIFTGRGGLGKYGERVAVPLNAFLWSPRNISSKFTMLNPAYYVKASPFVRKEALRALIAVASAGLTSLALYKMAGASVSTDSTSSDFGKAKFGNTRVDPWGGLQQNVVTGVRIGTYIKNAALLLQGKSIPKGEMYRPGTGYNTRTAHDVAIDFMENKESPAVGFASSMLNLGKSFEPSGVAGLLPSSRTSNVPGSSMFPSLSGDNNRLSKQIINLYTPMLIDDLVSIAQDDPKLLPLGLSSLYGQSVNTYSSKPRSPFRTRLAPPAPSAP
jgi:hypothetical protein